MRSTESRRFSQTNVSVPKLLRGTEYWDPTKADSRLSDQQRSSTPRSETSTSKTDDGIIWPTVSAVGKGTR